MQLIHRTVLGYNAVMTNRRTKRRLVVGCFLCVALLLGGGIWIAYQAVSVSIQAECALHAVNLTTVVVDKYVAREGKWPRSWDDLRTVSSVNAPTMYSWPEDWQKVRLYVTVDFDADPATLATQTVEEFDAIRPIGPSYPYKQYGHVADLLNTLKKSTSSRQEQHSF